MANKTLFCSFYALFCTFCASLWLTRTVFRRPKTSLPHEIAQRYLFGVISVNPVILPNFSPCLRVIRGEKIREISVNPWLIKDLRSTKDFVRKNNLFMQNKANFRKVKLDVNNVLTRDYDQMDTWSIRKKQSQTKPNKAKFKKAEMNVTTIITVGYENKPPIRALKKQSQTSKRQKPMQTSLPKGITKITTISVSDKTNPNKPNPPALTMVNRLVHRVQIPYKSPVAFPKHIAILMTNGTRRHRAVLQTLTDGFQSLVIRTK